MLLPRVLICACVLSLFQPGYSQDEPGKKKKEKPEKAEKVSPKDQKKKISDTYMAPFQPFSVPSLEVSETLLGAVLYHTMYVGFDTTKGILTHAWMPDAPPPKMNGFMYLEPGRKPLQWVWYENGKPVQGVKADYLDSQLAGDSLVLVYALVHPTSQAQVTVRESLFCMRDKMPDRPGLSREFSITGAPEGVTLGLTLEARSLMTGADLKYSGKWLQSQKVKRIFDWGDLYDFFGEMEITPEKPTVLRMYFPLDPERIAKSSGSTTTGN